MKYKTCAIKPEHMHQTGNRWTPSRIRCAFFLLLVSYEAAGLLYMGTENCDFVHNYICWCASTVCSMCPIMLVCESENVHTGLVLSAFVLCYGLHKYWGHKGNSLPTTAQLLARSHTTPEAFGIGFTTREWSVGGWNLLGSPCVILNIVSSSLKKTVKWFPRIPYFHISY